MTRSENLLTRGHLQRHLKGFTFTWFPRTIEGAVVLCGVALVILVFSEVWLRYIFHLSLLWVEEITVIPGFWLYMMGASYGSYERTHIQVDVMGLFIKDDRKKLLLRIITVSITLVIALFFLYWGYEMFRYDLSMNQRSYTLLLPMVWARSSIFFGGLFMAFYFLIELVDLVGQRFGKAPLYQAKQAEEEQ